MTSLRLACLLVALAHGLVPDSLRSGALRSSSPSFEKLFLFPRHREVLLQSSSTHTEVSEVMVVPDKNMETVVHIKEKNGEYKKGSPLYNTQEGIAEIHVDKKATVETTPEAAPAGSLHEHSGRLVVYGMAATVLLLSLSFAMANSSNRLVSNFTWCTLDNIISIFLAVLVFQAIDEVVYDARLIPKSHYVFGSFLYAMTLLIVAVGLSFLLKGSPSNLAIFVASSAHFVAFGFMHSATLGFEAHSSRFQNAMVIFLVVLLIIGFVYLVSYQIKYYLGISNIKDLLERVDMLETDAGAMAASMSWTILMCYLMTSNYQDIVDTESVASAERHKMLIYAIVISVLGAALIHAVASLKTANSYVKKRFGMFVSAVVAMCIAWAWLLWVKWRFHEHPEFESNPMFSRIIFAFCASLVTLAIIVVLAMAPGQSQSAKQEKALALLTVSLVAGWAWEETFDAGIENLADGHQGNKAAYKVMCALCMIFIVLPVHVIYFKPIVANLRDK